MIHKSAPLSIQVQLSTLEVRGGQSQLLVNTGGSRKVPMDLHVFFLVKVLGFAQKIID